MSVTAPLVQQLHRINRQKTDLLGQLDRGPKTVAAATRRLQASEQNVTDIHAKLTKMKIEADSKQLQMREREQKILKWQGNLNASKDNREYQALKDQIAADEQANLVLSDEILELLESIDSVTQAQADAEEVVAQLRDELARIEQQVADKKVVLESELARVLTELAAAEKELTGDFKREYTRLVAAKGEDAMAELEGKCCGGCYQSLTPQLLDKLLQGQPILCPSCGRLIYQDHDR
jgi:predicted  nucleic acid-binding Zn-ribbon protein